MRIPLPALAAVCFVTSLAPAALQAQVQTNPTQVQTLSKLINEHRNNSAAFNKNISTWPPNQSLIAADPAQKGIIVLPAQAELMKSAQTTAERLANRTYKYAAGHHQLDGQILNGPTVRAIKAGWSPSVNSYYTAGTTPAISGIRENLFEGPANLSPAAVLKGWQESPGHNFALLKAQARSMGVGFAQNAQRSYWVFLVESDAHFDETPANSSKYFGMGQLYKFIDGVRPNPSLPAAQIWRVDPAVVDTIRKNQ